VQKKSKKSVIIFLMILAVLLALRIYMSPEARVRRIVTQNQEELQQIAEDTLDGNAQDYKSSKNDGVFTSENGYRIVQFYLTGFGLGSATSYTGFIYSPDDRPVCYQNMDFELQQLDDETWEWEEDGSDNGGTVKKIADKWYYYKAWF